MWRKHKPSFRKKAAIAAAGLLLYCNLMGTAAASSYQIQQGDTLSTIASSHKVTVAALKKANNLTNDVIYAGNYLYIPDGGAQHTVAAGETLGQLARRYKVTVESLKQANGLSGDAIYAGQTLWIPLAEVPKITSRANGNVSATQAEIDLMAKAVYGEARGESLEGQIAVAAVILNRVESAEFPNTISEVVYQPWAFTAVHDGQINLAPDTQAYAAVRQALNGYDPTYGATYYWNPKNATSQWIWSRGVVTQIGQHLFGY